MANIFRAPLIFRTWRRDPYGVAIGSQSWVWQDPQVLRLVGKDKFFWAGPPDYDWPNPTLPKSRWVADNTRTDVAADRLLTLLKGRDTLFGAPGQVPDFDWTNPVWPKSRHVALVSQSAVWQARNQTLYVGKDKLPENQSDWPNPVLAKSRWVSITSQDQVLQNQLTGILSSPTYVVSPPLVFRNWVKDPGGAALGAQANAWQNRLTTTLVGQDRLPYNQEDWPNPILRKEPWGSALRAETGVWQDRLTNILLGKDRLPFRQQAWANPQRARGDQPIIIPPNLLALVAGSSDATLYIVSPPLIFRNWSRDPSVAIGAADMGQNSFLVLSGGGGPVSGGDNGGMLRFGVTNV